MIRRALSGLAWGEFLVLAGCAAVPLLSLAAAPWALLADPSSEVPVKLWVFETFWRDGLFGGRIETAGWPNVGSLNNPDPMGTLVTGALRPMLGRIGAYNTLVYLQLLANMLAMRSLLGTIVGSPGARVYGAVAFGLTPLVLVYCVNGAVTDMLNLWPWVMALRFGLGALRSGWREGAAAGLFAGLGFVTCPYNAVIFSVIAVPMAPFLYALVRAGPSMETPATRGGMRVAGLGLIGIVFGAVLLTEPYALWMDHILRAADSQMSAETVAETRHSAPYPYLQPTHPDRYTAFLSDYVATGKDALISREAGSRYFRAFSPGISLLVLGIVGLVTQRRRAMVAMWWAVAAFCITASLGPFTPLSAASSSPTPNNPVWLGLLAVWPGAPLLLEPFRYALPAVVGLAVAASCGVDALASRFGRWVAPAALTVWLLELTLTSPVPLPLPVASFGRDDALQDLDRILGPGAILSLPWFDRASDRFERVHFYQQLVHRRPIADEVKGFPPRYLCENNYTAALLELEKPTEGRIRVQVQDRDRIEADRLLLVEDGFAGIVVNPAKFSSSLTRERVRGMLKVWGAPTKMGGLEVYRLNAE